MYLAPINFTGETRYRSGQGPNKLERYSDLMLELRNACFARRAGVNAPCYMATPTSEHTNGIKVKYEQEGEIANPGNNPITNEHLDNLFTNFYRMEKIGFCHGYLTDKQVLFGENGKVQIDLMKYAKNFIGKDGQFVSHNEDMPDFVMPSNADNYERQGLCSYIAAIEDEEAQSDFVKMYLQNKSEYHKFRTSLLEDKGFKPSDKTLQFEALRSEVFKNPSDDIVNFEKDKLLILNMKKEAIIMWNDGNGAFGGTLSPKKRFASAIIMLEALKRTLELEKRADILSQEAPAKTIQQYFEFEKECLAKMSNNLYKDAIEGADDNFCCPTFGTKGLYLGSIEDRQAFGTQYSNVNLGYQHCDANCLILTNAIEFYFGLAQDWNSDANQLYKQEYFGKKAPVFA